MPNSFILFFCHVPFEQGIFFGNHLKCVFLLLAFITKWIEIYSGTNLVRILCSNFQHYYFLLILNESIDKCASYGVSLMINSFLLFIHGNFNWCTPPGAFGFLTKVCSKKLDTFYMSLLNCKIDRSDSILI